MTETTIRLSDRKWSVEDYEYGAGVAILNRTFTDELGRDMVEWEFSMSKPPYGFNYTQSVSSFIIYLTAAKAKKHWTVGA